MVERMLRLFTVVMLPALLLAAIAPLDARAQTRKWEITPTFSYMWAGSYQTIDGDIHLDDGAQYGGIIDYAFQKDARFEFYYATLASHATFSPYYIGVPSALDGLDVDMRVHYFQVGSIYQLPRGKAQPFFGLLMGAVLFSPSGQGPTNVTLSDTWRFAISFEAGVKIYLSEVVGLRLQGRLMLPIYFYGGGLWVGTGGASVGVSGGIPIVQGDLGVGLVIAL